MHTVHTFVFFLYIDTCTQVWTGICYVYMYAHWHRHRHRVKGGGGEMHTHTYKHTHDAHAHTCTYIYHKGWYSQAYSDTYVHTHTHTHTHTHLKACKLFSCTCLISKLGRGEGGYRVDILKWQMFWSTWCKNYVKYLLKTRVLWLITSDAAFHSRFYGRRWISKTKREREMNFRFQNPTKFWLARILLICQERWIHWMYICVWLKNKYTGVDNRWRMGRCNISYLQQTLKKEREKKEEKKGKEIHLCFSYCHAVACTQGKQQLMFI